MLLRHGFVLVILLPLWTVGCQGGGGPGASRIKSAHRQSCKAEGKSEDKGEREKGQEKKGVGGQAPIPPTTER